MAKLVFHSGAYQGKRVTLPPGKSITLGRNRDIDLPLPDPKLSRKHCQVVSRGDQFIIRDLNSTNGTFVNGTRLNGEYQLKPFDRIVLGDTELEFMDEVSARARPDAARTAIGSPAVAMSPKSQPAVAVTGDVIDSGDLLEDIIEEPAAAPALAAGHGAPAVVEEIDASELLDDAGAEAPAPAAAAAQAPAAAAGDIIVEEVLIDVDPANQIPVPVPQRAISAPPGKSGRLAPGFLAPPAQAPQEAPAVEEVIEETGTGEPEPEGETDPLEEALYELSLPLPPEPPPLQTQEQRPKVLFCDGCDASIPLLDWDLNLAQPRNGKMYCQQCLPRVGRGGMNGGHGSAQAVRRAAPAPAQGHPRSVTPMPPGHDAPEKAPAPQEKRISDILAGLDEEAVVVDTTIKRRGQVVQDEEISKQLQTLDEAQQKSAPAAPANGRPSHAVAGRGARPAGFLGANQAAPATAPRPAPAPARPAPAAPANSNEPDPLLEEFDEIK